jgi:glycosidase
MFLSVGFGCLANSGVDILWLMPIHPIGELNRKGTLGSQYAAKNYLELDPALGNKTDLLSLVNKAHQLGMYVILDWVANHTAWDNIWVNEHLDWYQKDDGGELFPYTYRDNNKVEYWTDVIGLDYNNKALWEGMKNAMAYWVTEFDIDGFRCDVAGLVPTPFWEYATQELHKIKHLFMLAEWSSPELHRKAFDMTYDWDLYTLMGDIASGRKDAMDVIAYYNDLFSRYPRDAYRMLFTTNHDKNTWEASDREYFGESFKAFTVLTMTLYGMPLIYSGQESILDKRLAFFEKDAINWKDFPLQQFYSELLALKRNNCALWNGEFGAQPEFLETNNHHVLSFVRRKNSNRVEVTINLSAESQSIAINQNTYEFSPYEYRITTTP